MAGKDKQLQRTIHNAFLRASRGYAVICHCYLLSQYISPVTDIETAPKKHEELNELEERFVEAFWDTMLCMNYLLYLGPDIRKQYYDPLLYTPRTVLDDRKVQEYLQYLQKVGALEIPHEKYLLQPDIMLDDQIFNEHLANATKFLDLFFQSVDSKRPNLLHDLIIGHYGIADDQAVKDQMELDFADYFKRRLGHYKTSEDAQAVIKATLENPETRNEILVNILNENANTIFPPKYNNKILAYTSEEELGLAQRTLALAPALEDDTSEEHDTTKDSNTAHTGESGNSPSDDFGVLITAKFPERKESSCIAPEKAASARIVPFPKM